MVSKKMNPLFLRGLTRKVRHSTSLMMPNGDPRDRSCADPESFVRGGPTQLNFDNFF